MVAKKKAVAALKTTGVTKAEVTKSVAKKGTTTKKVKIGILVGKDFDPVKKGTHPPHYPKDLILTETEWGKYSVDTCTALKIQQAHPDLLDVDIILEKDVTEKRLQQNHVNISFWPEIGTAMMAGNKKLTEEATRCIKNEDCRLDPSWDYYDWILCKPRYVEQCVAAGIPYIDTVVYKNGFDPKQCLADVQKKGWDKFFVKVGMFSFFGKGAIHGKTEDFLGKRAKDLEKYAKENKTAKYFLLQPFTLKPNGEVFDEVRNFFIDGQWRYSVFTHGTDESDAGYYEEPDGPRKEACKAMAERVYQEVLKSATWEGKRQTPLLNRIDIGVIPMKGACSKDKTDNKYFLNEIENICTTWLDRYSPISVPDAMATATVKHAMELLAGMLNNPKRKVPDEADVRRVVNQLNDRLGPFQSIKIKP
jgi:hypothetical protein